MVQSIGRLTPLSDVLARIDALVRPVVPASYPREQALGAVLAQDVVARRDLPATARALRDGFAVCADAIGDASDYAPVLLAAPAPLLDSGGELPHGADTVVPLDLVDPSGAVLGPVPPGEGVLSAGADIRSGVTLLKAGTRLTRGHIALLAEAGIESVSARRPFRVDHLEAFGGDLVIARGGTGQGRGDSAVERLARLGAVEAHGLALAPGESAAFGMIGDCPVVLLPGRFDGALAAWLTVGHPVMMRRSGMTMSAMVCCARLTRKIVSPLGFAEVVPVALRGREAEPLAQAGAAGFWPLAALTGANGWILVPPESEGYPEGSDVKIHIGLL